MPVHAAFLRGLNLGGRRVKMEPLRGHFEELGLDGVGSYRASGNVVFDHPGTGLGEVEAEIEAHLADALGYEVDTFVRALDDLRPVVGADPVEAAREDGFNPHVVFLRGEAAPEVGEALAALETPDDRFEVLGREVVWLRRGGLSDAPISMRELEAALGGPEHTMRTMNTVERLVEKFGG